MKFFQNVDNQIASIIAGGGGEGKGGRRKKKKWGLFIYIDVFFHRNF